MLEQIRKMRSYWNLPRAARAEHRLDRYGLEAPDPGVERVIDESVSWLCRAQDNSLSRDDGVARHYSLATGWSTSYPETTGYIVPTMLAYSKLRGDEEARQRAKRMLEWLVSIQLPCGGFQGGMIDETPVVPVTFNTGQILLGLTAGVREFRDKKYLRAMRRAADWLVAIQDPDGCWREYSSPFAAPGEKAYDTHIACGLLEAAHLDSNKRYADTAMANVRWALRSQQENGWFDKCCLIDSSQPLTHTLGYVLRGIIDAYRFTKDQRFSEAAMKTADGLLTAITEDGFLAGRLDSNWRATVPWACLTGTVQVAICWLMLYQETGDIRYRNAGYAGNRYVRRTMKLSGPPETRGAIKGSFPVHGAYGTYQYLNWACKFFIDSNMLELVLATPQQNKSLGKAPLQEEVQLSFKSCTTKFEETKIAHVECLSAVDPQEWDKQAERLDGCFFHSHAYGKYESIRSHAVPLFVKAFDQKGECVGIVVGNIVSHRFWPFASYCRSAIFGALPATGDKSGAMERAIMLAVEKELERKGVYQVHVSAYDSPNSACVLPALAYSLNDRHEFYIDLSRPLDHIWKTLKANRRTHIRKAENLHVETTIDNSIAGLRLLDAFQASSMLRRGVEFSSMDAVAESAKLMLLNSGRAILLISSCDGTPVNGAMFGLFGDRAYYLYSGSSLAGNKCSGPVHLIWTVIQLLKGKGFRSVNLGGVANGLHDGSVEHKLYNFKNDFGARVVRQPAGTKIISRLGASLSAILSGLKRVAVR